jgi:hypothetical protein
VPAHPPDDWLAPPIGRDDGSYHLEQIPRAELLRKPGQQVSDASARLTWARKLAAVDLIGALP